MNSFGYYPYSFGGYNSYPMNYGMPMMSYAPATTDNKAAPATPYTMPMTTMPSTTMPYYSNYGIPASYGTPMYYKNGMEYKFESQRGMTFPIAPTVPYAVSILLHRLRYATSLRLFLGTYLRTPPPPYPPPLPSLCSLWSTKRW